MNKPILFIIIVAVASLGALALIKNNKAQLVPTQPHYYKLEIDSTFASRDTLGQLLYLHSKIQEQYKIFIQRGEVDKNFSNNLWHQADSLGFSENVFNSILNGIRSDYQKSMPLKSANESDEYYPPDLDYTHRDNQGKLER